MKATYKYGIFPDGFRTVNIIFFSKKECSGTEELKGVYSTHGSIEAIVWTVQSQHYWYCFPIYTNLRKKQITKTCVLGEGVLSSWKGVCCVWGGGSLWSLPQSTWPLWIHLGDSFRNGNALVVVVNRNWTGISNLLSSREVGGGSSDFRLILHFQSTVYLR